MIDAIDNGLLVSDFNASGFSIINVAGILPIPTNLVSTSDTRLTDRRMPLDGSVTNSSIASNAAIDQSKLNLSGVIPIAWLGFDSTHAANGDLTEYLVHKGAANGYASLDGTGKVPVGQLPPGLGTGTVTSVALTMPGDFSISGSPVTTSGTIAVSWNTVPNNSWFGNVSGVSAVPVFNTVPIAASMVPFLDASKISTGIISRTLLPPAQGVGIDHAPGMVPDPGAVGSSTDYLARDMTFKPPPSFGIPYQPMVPDPVLAPSGSPPTVAISDSLAGVSLFYKVTPVMTAYLEAPPTVQIQSGQTINVYGAKAGYTNSNIVFYVAP